MTTKEKVFDLTTKQGIEKVRKGGWLTKSDLPFLALGPAVFLVKKLVDLARKGLSHQQRAELAEHLIEVGKEKGVKRMRIRLNKEAAARVEAKIEGTPITNQRRHRWILRQPGGNRG